MSRKTPLRFRRFAARGITLFTALGLAIMLSGCVIEPIGPYYHPHHYYGY